MNKYKYIKLFHIIAILISFWLSAFSCQKGVQVEKFVLPEDVLQDASTAFIKSDSEGLVQDYATISSGQTLSDGYTISEETDAQKIDKAVQPGRKIVFVRLGDKPDSKEHALRAIASAAVRLQSTAGEKSTMFNLNLLALNRLIATYNFTDDQAREYYLSVAKKLNDEKLSEKNVVIIDVDLLERGLSPALLFQQFGKPSIIAISKASKDTLKLVEADQQKSDEVRLTNLDPGEVFSLSQQRFARAAGFKNNKAEGQNAALVVAKIVAATDPKDNLGNFNRILRAVRPIIETAPLSANFEDELIKAIASELELDVNFIK
ncbi:MAG TPA: hypothetical protein VEK06_03680, partial [Myxococcota bacterium]|nr:hypothetical protein [Myxococcota bacterium]